MAGEKRFRTAIFGGFKRADVAAYMEKLIIEYEEKTRKKDEEISSLKTKMQELDVACSKFRVKAEAAITDREKIANVLLNAEEMAEEIIKRAKEQADDERRKLEIELEIEREKIVESRVELKELRRQAVDTMKNFSVQLQDMVDYSKVG